MKKRGISAILRSMKRDIEYAIKDFSGFIVDLNQRNDFRMAKWIPDALFLKCWYKKKTGKVLHLHNPKELNEKLQWLKLYNRNPLYTKMADKAEAKNYIREMVGEQYLIPTIGVWDSFEDIDFAELPNQFVLKCTHDSGSVVVCTDKGKLNIEETRTKLTERLNNNYFWKKREWPYKNIKPRIICEPLLQNADRTPLVDYKFYCYGGKPRYFMYSIGEAQHAARNHKFDMNLVSIDHLFKPRPALSLQEVKLPDNMEQMISIVEKLCTGHQHIRVDLYNIDGKIYVGELTFFSNAGILNMCSVEYAQELASYIELDRK